MTLFRTVDPLGEPISVADAKIHMRIDHTSEDGLIAGLIAAARDEVEAQTGLALIDQDWRLTTDGIAPSGIITLKRHPVREVLSVTLFDADGAASLLDPSHYLLDCHARPAILCIEKRPAASSYANGIEIDFKAGFGESGADVPDGLKRAVLLLVAHWYEFRAGFGASDQPVSWPPGFDRLVARWKLGRL